MVGTFVLQWHLSENCNLKCLHCYQEDHKPMCISYNKLEHIYNEFINLIDKLNMNGHINITGGEPFCNPHLFKVLDLIKKDNRVSFSILTNGTLIDDKTALKLKEYNPYYVQVSLEGGKKMNDYIRGKGTYKQIAKGIKSLKKAGIFTSISFTANHLNYKELPKVIKYAKRLKVDNVWSDRYIPLGGSMDKDLTLTRAETSEYLDIMAKERIKLGKKSKTRLSMNRALQFTRTNNYAYGCTCGDTLLTVMENGDLVPCRRMPIVVGNLLKDNLSKLYYDSDIMKNLRKDTTPDDCKKCEHKNTCNGGLKCLTFACFNDLNHKDIGCNL